MISNLIEAGAKGGVPDGIRVLVAGANTASLHVMRETLASRHMEMVTADGVESALAAFREASQGRRPFALVILDPKISGGRGLELARTLRGPETEVGPAVVVVTFKAELKEAEEYRAAGVRAYIEQPVTQPELMTAINEALASESLERLSAFSGRRMAVPPFEGAEDPSIMRALAPEVAFDGALFESDPEFLAEIVSLFLKTYPPLLRAIEDAIVQKDAPGLCRAAHALKGAVANFGAKALVEQASALETMGKKGDLWRASEGGAALRALMDQLEPELHAALKIAMEQVVL